MYAAGAPGPAARACAPGTTRDHPPGGPGGDGKPIGVTVSASVRHRTTPHEGAVPWAARNSPRWRTSWGPAGCPEIDGAIADMAAAAIQDRAGPGLGPGLNDPALGPV